MARETLADQLGSCFSLHEYVEVDNVIVNGLLRSSDRLFFEPGETSSIMEVAKAQNMISYNSLEENVEIVEMDSCDPFLDLRASMEEMIRAHGLKSWERLEDLLTCYLKVNVKSNHGYIVGAFVDLLVNISLKFRFEADNNNDGHEEDAKAFDNCSSPVNHHHRHEGSFTSPLSFCTTSCSFNSPSMEVSHEGLVVKSHVFEIKSAEESVISSCSSSSFSCNASSSTS